MLFVLHNKVNALLENQVTDLPSPTTPLSPIPLMLPSSWNSSPMRMLISVGHGAYCALSTGPNKLDTGADECFDNDCACAMSVFAGTGSV